MTRKICDDQREEIRRLTLSGMRTTHIATELKLNRNTVIKTRKALGLPGKPILPEKQILALLKTGMEQREIGRTLGVPHRKVGAIARAAGYARPRRGLSEIQFRSLLTDIGRRQGSAASLAKKHAISYKLVLKLAHLLLGCGRFLPSHKNPLSSDMPSNFVPVLKRAEAPQQDEMTTETKCVAIVERVLRICNLRQVPADRVAFNSAICDVLASDVPLIYKKHFEFLISQAIDIVATQQGSAVH